MGFRAWGVTMPNAGRRVEICGEGEITTTRVGDSCKEDPGLLGWNTTRTSASSSGGGLSRPQFRIMQKARLVGRARTRRTLGSGRASSASPKSLAKEWPRGWTGAHDHGAGQRHLAQRQQWRTARPSEGLGQTLKGCSFCRGNSFEIQPECQGSEPRQVRRCEGWHGHGEPWGKLAILGRMDSVVHGAAQGHGWRGHGVGIELSGTRRD